MKIIIAFLFLLSSFNALTQKAVYKKTGNNPLSRYSVASGRNSYPVFADIDGDGDLDCFSGELSYNSRGTAFSKIYFFRNEGNESYALFHHTSLKENPMSAIYGTGFLSPSFVDLDKDGDMDCFVADSYGTLAYFKNTGSVRKPVFEMQSPAFNPLFAVKYDGFENPQVAFADIDQDEDADCLITDAEGNEVFYKNTGTATVPSFKTVGATSDPFHFMAGDNMGNISFCDWNKDGLTDLFIGTEYYKNIGTGTNPSFTLIKEESPLIKTTVNSPLQWVDLNNNGDFEIVTGTASGSFDYLCAATTLQTVKNIQIKAYPNPSPNEFTITIPSVVHGRVFIQVNDLQGKIITTAKASSSVIVFGKELKSGIYNVSILENGKIISTQKIIKQ